MLTTSTSADVDLGNTNSNKSIYTKHPGLFKYESDQNDKQWLFDNSIIQKKMVKLYIFLYTDLLDLFKTATFIDKQNEYAIENSDDETNSDSEEISLDESVLNSAATNVESNEIKNNRIEFINKQLKPFVLPQQMVNKIKKQYLNFKKKI